LIRKTAILCYLAFLGAIAFWGMFHTWFNEPLLIFVAEVAIDLILIAGVILYWRGVFHKVWIFVFTAAVILQSIVLARSPYVEFADFMVWILMLVPAVYMNIIVCGLFGAKRKSGDDG